MLWGLQARPRKGTRPAARSKQPGSNSFNRLSARSRRREKTKKGIGRIMSSVAVSAQVAKKSYSPIQYVHIAITLFFMFAFGFFPPFATLTPVGMRVLGVFIGVVYGYSTCDIIWPSLFAIIAFGISGYTTMGAAITSMIGHNVVFQSIVGFISAGALRHYGFGKWFVRWSLTKKIFRGKPLFYTWCFMLLFGLSAIVINQIQLQILLYSIWLDIADSCGYAKDSTFRYAGMAGILFSTVLGGAMVPYTSWMLGLANNWSDAVGIPLNFGMMGIISVIVSALAISLYVLCMRYVLKVDFSIMKYFDVEKLGEESKHLRPRAKRIFVIYIITVVLVVVANTLPVTHSLNQFVNQTMTVAGVYCACAAVLLILPSGEGDAKGCVEFNAIKDSSISWQVIFMCAVTLPVAAAVTSPDCGILEWLTGVFTPIFAGRSGTFVLVFTIIVSMFLTNLGSNIAFGAAMIPIIVPFVLQSGMNPQLAGAAMIYIINIGLILPGASAPASIYHSNEFLPDSKKRTLYTSFACLVMLVIAIPFYGILSAIIK